MYEKALPINREYPVSEVTNVLSYAENHNSDKSLIIMKYFTNRTLEEDGLT